jgi:hypothetical protein
MRTRVFAAAVGLGLVVAGISLAQQTAPRPRDRAGEASKLRAQVVKLRGEIDLLELDHEAARVELLQIVKDIRELESEGNQAQMKSLANLQLMLGGGSEALAKEAEHLGVEGAAKKVKEAVNTAVKESVSEEVVKTRASRDRKRADYARQAAQLAEKRLDLVEAERRYDAIRFAAQAQPQSQS